MTKTLVELCIGAVGILAVMISFLGSEPNATQVWSTFEPDAQVKLIFTLPKEHSVEDLANGRYHGYIPEQAKLKR